MTLNLASGLYFTHKVRTLIFIRTEDGIMKTGEFAKACGAESALRYYDKQGLLRPVYTDRFTGYRYYSAEQAEVCKRIGTLKAGGNKKAAPCGRQRNHMQNFCREKAGS